MINEEYKQQIYNIVKQIVKQLLIDEGICRGMKRSLGYALQIAGKKAGTRNIGKFLVKSCEEDDKKDTAIRQHNQFAKERANTTNKSKINSLDNKMGRLKAKYNLSDNDIKRGTTEIETKIINGAKAIGNGAKTLASKVHQAMQNKNNPTT